MLRNPSSRTNCQLSESRSIQSFQSSPRAPSCKRAQTVDEWTWDQLELLALHTDRSGCWDLASPGPQAHRLSKINGIFIKDSSRHPIMVDWFFLVKSRTHWCVAPLLLWAFCQSLVFLQWWKEWNSVWVEVKGYQHYYQGLRDST